MLALLFFRDIRIALETPPAPMTRVFLFCRVMFSSSNDFEKPIASVLYPSLLWIVFTAWICFASFFISSRYFITWILCGIVMFSPSYEFVFMKCSRFSGRTSIAL